MKEAARDIELRTFAADALSIAHNEKPQAEKLSVTLQGEAFTKPQEQRTPDSAADAAAMAPQKKGSGVLISALLILFLGALGYLVFLLI